LTIIRWRNGQNLSQSTEKTWENRAELDTSAGDGQIPATRRELTGGGRHGCG
jgi:hypothetical protein